MFAVIWLWEDNQKDRRFYIGLAPGLANQCWPYDMQKKNKKDSILAKNMFWIIHLWWTTVFSVDNVCLRPVYMVTISVSKENILR